MKSVTLFIALCASIAFALTPALARSGDRQDPAGIRTAIDNFLRTQTAGSPGEVTYTVGAIDSRVVLGACPVLEVFLPAGARLWGATSVGVRCGGANPWNIYVPAQIKIAGDYIVTARSLTQGQTLTSADVVVQHGDLTQLPPSTVTDLQQAVGKALSAGLAAGQPLRLDVLRAALVVQQGQSVKVQSIGRGFRVSSEGKALNNAAEGQVAQARTASGQTVSGIARDGGVIEVRF